MKALNIVDTAYRATLEEQDDTSLWFIHAIRKSGALSDVLLSGNAVNYLVKHQNPKPLNIGTAKIHYPNKFQDDLTNLAKDGCKLFFVKDDVITRGIKPDSLVTHAEGLDRSQLADFIDGYDDIWHW
jgi:sulfur relay (sulfurtransferase) DsrF/TusC family protein